MKDEKRWYVTTQNSLGLYDLHSFDKALFEQHIQLNGAYSDTKASFKPLSYC